MKIFGIGLSRTGTSSLSLAMEILGYKSKHYLSNNPISDIDNHDFLCDMPIQTRYKTYDRIYPNSKFILTIRSKQSWLDSCRNYYIDVNKTDFRYRYRIEQNGISGFDELIFSKKYDDHLNEISKYFKLRQKNLLIFDICAGESWDKLCKFLSKPIPNVSFPYENKYVKQN